MRAAQQLRTCSACPSTISPQSKTGRCRSCAAKVTQADPAFRARLEASLRAASAKPERRAAMRATARRVHAEKASDPAWQAQKRASGLRLRAAYDGSADAQAANLAKRSLVGRKNHIARMAWCPPDRVAEYQRLRAKHGAPEARRLIEVSMTSFERQLVRLAHGAVAVPAFKPAVAGPAFTLGGVATGALS